MESIKLLLKYNPMTRGTYRYLKNKKDTIAYNKCFHYSGHFDNRSKGHEKMCLILAGYKPFLYDAVFSRIKAYLPDDVDVCIASSGLFSEELSSICNQNDWSYLSTKENNVSLVENVVIKLHPQAQYIYKLDEDIFITENYFQRLFEAYNSAKEGDYNPGVMTPLLLINGFTSLIILDKLGARSVFVDRFGSIKHEAGTETTIEKSVDAARFLWGEDGVIPSIDEMNRRFYSQKQKVTPCPIRFSIGAILFERTFWERMHYFDVVRKDKNMLGKDEAKLCEHCIIYSLPIMVSENIVVGHFSFGKQTEGMKEYFAKHPERFVLKE